MKGRRKSVSNEYVSKKERKKENNRKKIREEKRKTIIITYQNRYKTF